MLRLPTVTFAAGGGGTLAVGTAGLLGGKIAGFGAGDTIDLTKLSVASVQFQSGTLTLFDQQGGTVGTMAFLGSYTTANFAITSDQHGRTDITYQPAQSASLAFANLVPLPGAASPALSGPDDPSTGFASDAVLPPPALLPWPHAALG
ncbi:MAG: hypothetical protein JSR21_12745 [Proteobacteria bacterium]|nr:hypothetical protein [Pseudomonadota bacterium]